MLAREVPFGLLGSLGRSFSDLAMQPKQQTVLRALLRGERVDMNHEGKMKEQAVTLLRRGLLLLDDDGNFQFPSPLHEWHYRKQVGCVVGYLNLWGPLLGHLASALKLSALYAALLHKGGISRHNAGWL